MQFSVDADITKAETIPSAFYADRDIFEQSKDKIFARSWQLIANSAELKIPGAVHPTTLLEGCLDEPLVLTRDLNDQLSCLSNVCTHRGNVVCEGAGTEKSLRCRYHGRRFDLNGKCTFMPEFDDVQGFPSVKDNLPGLPIYQWGPWLFTSLNPALEFEQWLQPVKEKVDWMPLNDFAFAPERARTYTVRAHWALYVDNYLEGFHIPYIHQALNTALDYGSYETVLNPTGNLQFGPAADGELCFDLPKASPDHGQNVAAYYFWVYPNFMLNFYPWGCSVNVVKPISPDLTKVLFLPYVWKPELMDQGAGSNLDRVEREDEVIVELVQKGTKSRLYDRGRYSPRRERGVHQFHRMICDSLNS